MSELSAEVLDIFDDETICKNELEIEDVENDDCYSCNCDCYEMGDPWRDSTYP